MPTILNIETSTDICSVTLSGNEGLLLDKICLEKQNHATQLPLLLKEIITFASQNRLNIDAVAVSAGPGSYTGLRIGVSSAKGICFAKGIPLIAIDTLKTIAIGAIKSFVKEALLCPMIDARRMEVYTAIYKPNLERATEIEAKIIDENSYKELLEKHKVVFCGNGMTKCKSVIKHKNAIFLDNINPLSTNMVVLANKKFKTGMFENVAYFEPFYLKEFVATKTKTKLF